jgi:hypothetical protein
VKDALLVGILQGLRHLDADPRHAAKVLGLGLVGQLRLIARWRRQRRRRFRGQLRSKMRLRDDCARRCFSADLGGRESTGAQTQRQGGRQVLISRHFRGGRCARIVPQPLDLLKDSVQPVPADELHGVVVKPLMLADAENRHDVGMVQPGRRAGLAPEPFQPSWVAEMVEGECLQGHVPAQRFLDRFVDHPHAARANGAEQEVIAEALWHRGA